MGIRCLDKTNAEILKFMPFFNILIVQTVRSFLTLYKGQLRNGEETAFLS